jgi:hypothetical protein
MKIKLKGSWIIALFIISYIVYIVILAVLGLPNSFYKSAPDYVNYNDSANLKPFDMVISDSVSFRKYRTMMDSINTIRDLKNGDYWGVNSIYFPSVLGTGGSIECDTCSLKWFKDTYSWHKHDEILKSIYYIKLLSWKLNDKSGPDWEWTRDSVQFYVEHNQPYIRKFVNNSLMQNHQRKLYHMVDIPVKFRFSIKEHCVMIPVSKTTKHIMDIVLGILDFLFFGWFFILIGDFIGFMMDISKGLAFTNKNLRTLKRITFTLFAIPIVELLFNLLLRLIFNSYLTSDVVLNIDTLDGYWKFLTIGIIFLMIYRAFRQGKKLKDDQALTI